MHSLLGMPLQPVPLRKTTGDDPPSLQQAGLLKEAQKNEHFPFGFQAVGFPLTPLVRLQRDLLLLEVKEALLTSLQNQGGVQLGRLLDNPAKSIIFVV